jgi:hypothetical protein
MKNIFKIFGLCLLGLLMMELAAKVFFPDVPDVGHMVVDSLYKSPTSASKLGEFQSFKFDVDSVSMDKKSYFISIKVQGVNSDTTLKGLIVKTSDDWKISKLSAN